MLEGAAGVGEILRRPLQHHGITIETDEFSGGTQAVEEDTAVSPCADCAVDDDAIGLEVEELEDFLDKDGAMHGRAAAFRAPYRLRHCGANEVW